MSGPNPEPVEVATPVGTARVTQAGPDGAVAGTLVLGHGAGGSITAPDLVATTVAARTEGLRVLLVEQPYRVAGKRTPPAASRLDAAWLEVLRALATAGHTGPLFVGGRSSGARVACRTARATGAAGVICLAFPWHPPGRPERSRVGELEALDLPVLVVSGDRDPFGTPPGDLAASVTVALLPGADHSLRHESADVTRLVRDWLQLSLRGAARSGPLSPS